MPGASCLAGHPRQRCDGPPTGRDMGIVEASGICRSEGLHAAPGPRVHFYQPWGAVCVDDEVYSHLYRPSPSRKRVKSAGHPGGERTDRSCGVPGQDIPAKLGPRRAGDPPRLFADPTKIRETLGWTPRYTDLEETVETAWRWMKANPTGYPDEV